MKKLLLALLVSLPIVSTAQSPAPANPPPQSATASKPAEAPTPSSAELTRLEPTEADMKKAREDRAKRTGTKKEEFVSNRGTKIETFTDPNNHMTSVRVTPSSTEIPYTMKNQANRPIPSGPTSNAHSTLSTPTFLELKW